MKSSSLQFLVDILFQNPSNLTMKILLILALAVIASAVPTEENGFASQNRSSNPTTSDRVRKLGYPVEEHSVQTADGYILTMFRIPYSPKLQNQNVKHKPVIFLQHGLLSSSDCWILNGQDNALAYMLVDAGYDVWLGNFRGNTYSRKHTKYTPLLPAFWSFSWHEMGIYDLPAQIDYVLYKTGEKTLHYVGHSQGTTTFLLMLASIPKYVDRFRTMHMLAPVAYMKNMKSLLAKVAAPLLSKPSMLSALIGSNEFLPNTKFLSLMGMAACQDTSIFQPMCGNALCLIAGWDSKHLNYTLLPDMMESHPAGASTSQLIHYLQEYQSGYYRQYDFGFKNLNIYGTKTPPSYFPGNIRTKIPINFYYSDNDDFAAVTDVLRLANEMGKNVKLLRVQHTDWNHLDFLWAIDVKEVINDVVLRLTNEYENGLH